MFRRTRAGTAGEPGGVELTNVSRTYGEGDTAVAALRGVSLRVGAGRFVAVMGPSGSGKSTLLHCAAGLERPDSGEVRVGSRRWQALDADAAAELRRTEVGFVFQQYNLIPFLTVTENVELPLRAAGTRVAASTVRGALDAVGLAHRAGHRPAALSGGEQQRVTIARALVTRPTVLFADEPTGALDTAAAARILRLLRAACDQHGQTIVMVTHDPLAASAADEVVFMADGRLAGTMLSPRPGEVAARMTALAAGSELASSAPAGKMTVAA